MPLAQDTGRDLETANWTLSQEADTLRRLVTQAAARKPDDLAALASEISRATEWRAYYVAGVPGLDTSEIDHVLEDAQAMVRGSGNLGSSIIQRDGLHVGKIVIPWIGVAAGVLFVGAAFAMRSRRRRRQ